MSGIGLPIGYNVIVKIQDTGINSEREVRMSIMYFSQTKNKLTYK